MRYLRALLVLGRVSNLPTVWSNCLAGWWLGGGGPWSSLARLCWGASCLYVAGMFLNDAFDASFDRQHRSERPIPSGAISATAVWRWGVGWMAIGLATLATHSAPVALLSLLLVVAILTYDAVHKMVAFSPVLMALCRFLLLLLATAFGQLGLGGLALWSALVLGGYIVGLSYIARRESTTGLIRFWPLLPLGAPILLAFIVNAGPYKESGLVLILLLALWIVKAIHPLWTTEQPMVGRAVSQLLAGICLVDLLAVADAPKPIAAVLLVFFGLSLALQRYVPAT
ncbi:MAG: UbiA family prenyltransferase [Verrucomicrobia bacterium]|nr:UbiA family prenyltransferase [Verrucomicrobiota bacterium]